jgi:hypothetical protein
LSEGVDLGASVFLDMVADASGADERHPCWIDFVHRIEKRVDNLRIAVRARRTQIKTHQKGRSQSKVLERSIYHYVREYPLAVGFILQKQANTP